MFSKNQIKIIILKNLAKAAVAVLFSIIVILFFSQQISQISNSLSETRKSSFILAKRNETLDRLRKDLAVIGGKDKKIEDALPSIDNILGFVETLESLASRHSLGQSYNFGTPVPFRTVDENFSLAIIDYNLTVNADAVALTNYLKDFEKIPYFSAISSININAPAGRGFKDSSLISMKAKLYAKIEQ